MKWLKRFINRELELYIREQKLAIKEQLQFDIEDSKNNLLNLKIQGAKDTADFEHEWHNKKEEERVVIAKLEAKREYEEAHAALTEAKSKAIRFEYEYDTLKLRTTKETERLTGIIRDLIEKLPTVSLKDLTVNVNNKIDE